MRRPRPFGTTAPERAAARPGDGLITEPRKVPAMATTLPLPPGEVWQYLIQMGCDRAGFYSWDRLDNGGRPSAQRIHEEWQDLAVGSQISAAPDGSVAFTVVTLEPEQALVLRLSLRLPTARAFDPARLRPRAYVDGTWGLFLTPGAHGGTRLVSTMRMTGRPGWISLPMHVLVVRPAHWIMQRKQFAELRRRGGVLEVLTPRGP